ncbi:ribosomal protein [Lithospermum erythrorhizon]|uniref:Ribosomal protein n=1 Tax=Lithospermum erythrorhizon TaxID=34254 RepID=A0AAV3QRS4_LITER
MASLISLSPITTSSTTSTSCNHPYTFFKGNVQTLKNKTSVLQNEVFSVMDKQGTRLIPGATKKANRKGGGHAAGQGGSCRFGMRGQKSRSGPVARPGFEVGQMPLYRRLPKLRGIAGGMRAGLPKYVPVSLKDMEAAGFKEGEERKKDPPKGCCISISLLSIFYSFDSLSNLRLQSHPRTTQPFTSHKPD